jgi:hypothetical protein
VTTWQDLSEQVQKRLAGMSAGQRCVFAAGVAERLMHSHEALPPDRQEDYTLSLRPLLDAVWDAACGNQTAFSEIKQALGEFYLSEYCHNDGQDGPDDADQSAAAAVLLAAESYMHGCLDFALDVSHRGVEAADNAGYEHDEAPGPDDDPDELIVSEMHRQLRDLDLLERYEQDLRYAGNGLDIETTSRMRREVRVPLSLGGDGAEPGAP